MIVKNAEFITSAAGAGQYPDLGLPEIAFAGRSNVGKSSMINCLVNRKHLVKTSNTPGKTRLINFFKINDRLVFVDLPGYGYAKVSKQEQKKWGPMVETYLSRREALKGVLLLMDVRRLPREDEFMICEWLVHYRLPLGVVLTKADKLKKNAQKKQLAAIARAFSLPPENLVLFSATQKTGRETVLHLIEEMAGIGENHDR